MTTRVLVVGLDAGDPTVARALAASGRMPALAELLARGARFPVTGARDSFVADRWTTMVTGVGPEVHRYYSWCEFDRERGTDRPGPLDPAGVARLWDVATDAGQRVAVLDVPRQPLAEVNGVQLCEWGAHDRDVGTSSWPPQFVEEVEARVGAHPLGAAVEGRTGQFAPCDVVLRSGDPRSRAERRDLATLIRRSTDVKAQLSEHALASEGWDLFFTVFAETHCAAHQFWDLHDPSNRRERRLAAKLGDVVADTFVRIDHSIGRLVQLAGPDAAVVVVLHTGMAQFRGGNALLSEVTRRLAGSTHAFVTCGFTGQVGTIRLRIAGRDVGGTVEPHDVPEVVERLTEDLTVLVDGDTGRSAVRSVRTRAEAFPGVTDDSLPDLFVDWSGEHAISQVSSPTIGTIAADPGPRTGYHTPDGLVVVRAPGMEPGARAPMEPAAFTPMVATLLGIGDGPGVTAPAPRP
jgi:predicted AlkP superfamily phosphohydrolase/phosphomutase